MNKRGHRYEIGGQPCKNLLRGDADIMALGEGNRSNVHQCPKCEGNRTWCENCYSDHHDGGWETCKPGAYADPPDDEVDQEAEKIAAEKLRRMVSGLFRNGV